METLHVHDGSTPSSQYLDEVRVTRLWDLLDELGYTAAAVDSGRLVIIDPCYLGPEGEDAALHYVERGLAVLVNTGGDGMCRVYETDDDDGNTALIIEPAPHQHPHVIVNADMTRWRDTTTPTAADRAAKLGAHDADQVEP